ncbi:hypothetical protein N7466_005336 [Penicillium verhagenii]|uniref:uncharacterized protein n=1 Tax=Penicillium verhagenii TaxID=1562060 RepID=UPI0025458DFE|nr:uncharacterized protein N7466_005336 [Penicillium verhagenii]KAJ5935789.1 hypothetical protein N7466_005336 [Penicillium verhagenii]
MATSKMSKRARANTAGDIHIQLNEGSASGTLANESQPPVPSPQEMQGLKAEQLTELLHKAAALHPDVNLMITTAIEKSREERQKHVVNFDQYSGSIWRQINVDYSSMRGSKQYEMAFDVAGSVSSTISLIAAKCAQFANPQTRRNGLETLRKIGKTICLSSNDTLGHEVQKQFQSDPSLENAMHDIVAEMSTEEREAIQRDPLWQKLEELEALANDHCVFDGLRGVLETIQGVGDDDDSDEGSEEGENEEYDEADEYGVTGDEHDVC